MGKKFGKGKDYPKGDCRACGGTGKVQNMKTTGVYKDPKTGKTYETLKPVWENCKCQN